MHTPDSQVMADAAGLLRAKSAMREIGWLERSMKGDVAPCFLERLSEAMLQWGWRLAAEIESSHLIYIYIYLDLQSGTFTGSGAGLPTPAFFWIWSGSFSKSLCVDSQGFAFFVVRISLKVNPLLMQ